MITLKSCPNCKSENIRIHKRVATLSRQIAVEIIPGVKIEAAPISYFSLCQKCGLIFQNPRMSNSELETFYGQGYYRRTIEMTSKEGDLDEEYRAKRNAKLFRESFGNVTSHLDVGCSRGYLLDAVGAKIKVGVETNPDYVAVRGVKIYKKLDQVPNEFFDLVTAIHVLEHEPYPIKYLQKMSKFVSKGGYFIIEVPALNGPGGSLRLAHLYHFEPDVLKDLCRKAGLDVINQYLTPHLMFVCKVENKSK